MGNRPRLRGCLTQAVLVAAAVAGCGGSGSSPTTGRTPPDLADFLRLPVATPSSCPSVSGTTSGRRSPWVGHVDVSVFVKASADEASRRALRRELAAQPHVAQVYSETQQQAYAEFQRLYTCSAQVPLSAVPASYRLVLDDVTTPQRDALVRAIYRMPGVGSVSCDPANPCVDVRAR